MSDTNLITPSHYGNNECAEILKTQLGMEGFCQFCYGNIIKYVYRYKNKNGLEDLKKAYTYATMGFALNDELNERGVRILTGKEDAPTYDGKNSCVATFEEFVLTGSRESYLELFHDLKTLLQQWISIYE